MTRRTRCGFLFLCAAAFLGLCYAAARHGVRVKVFWAWFDFWIGAFYDEEKTALYICPLPTLVFKFHKPV